jgi:hypothetical protein
MMQQQQQQQQQQQHFRPLAAVQFEGVLSMLSHFASACAGDVSMLCIQLPGTLGAK